MSEGKVSLTVCLHPRNLIHQLLHSEALGGQVHLLLLHGVFDGGFFLPGLAQGFDLEKQLSFTLSFLLLPGLLPASRPVGDLGEGLEQFNHFLK